MTVAEYVDGVRATDSASVLPDVHHCQPFKGIEQAKNLNTKGE
jgi:hypothetical protein